MRRINKLWVMMKTVLIIIVTFLSSNLLAQDFCVIRLVDSYSYDQIKASQINYLSQKNYRIDSTTSLIVIEKTRGKKISIQVCNYESQTSEIAFKKHLGDTIVIQMKPVDSIIQIRFKELYSTNVAGDTLNFESLDQVDRKLNSYLNYLTALNGQCENGMCNYSNTYSYIIQFINEEGVYRIDSIIKLQPREYQCAPLDDALNKLKNNFPKFRLDGENNEIRKRFTMTLN